jgi:hypothetical protein
MPNEHQLLLWRADQARADFAATESDLEVIQARLALLPTGKNLPLLKVLATAGTAALVSVGIEVLSR